MLLIGPWGTNEKGTGLLRQRNAAITEKQSTERNQETNLDRHESRYKEILGHHQTPGKGISSAAARQASPGFNGHRRVIHVSRGFAVLTVEPGKGFSKATAFNLSNIFEAGTRKQWKPCGLPKHVKNNLNTI